MRTSRCKACGAEIIWSRTVNDKAIPLDYPPNPDGNVRIVNGIAHVYGPLDLLLTDDADELFMPHHATCPNWGT